jgi:hypothetical protein
VFGVLIMMADMWPFPLPQTNVVLLLRLDKCQSRDSPKTCMESHVGVASGEFRLASFIKWTLLSFVTVATLRFVIVMLLEQGLFLLIAKVTSNLCTRHLRKE